VSFYAIPSVVASACGDGVAGDGVIVVGQGAATRMVAIPLSELTWPVRAGSGGDDRSALVVGGGAPIRTGVAVAWCKIVVVAPAVVRRDGRVQADGRPCDHARLGAAEQELDRRCGPGTIERIAAGVRPTGKIKAVARREMSVACTLRAVLLMTLMPDADHREVLTTGLGELVEVPWRRAHAVPSGTVLSTWRAAIGAAPMAALQRELLAAVGAEHRADGLSAVEVGGGLRLGAIDGTVTRMPDTAANRAAFGTAGAAETGYPQIRHLHVSDALTRATLGVVTGPAGGDKAEAEHKLLDRMLAEQPQVFTPDRLWIMDRNFPGVARIAAMLATGTHVLIRVKSDIRLSRIGEFAPDGSYLARLSGGGTTLTVRVIEYHIDIDGAPTPELFCLVTDLLDHHTHPAHQLAEAYRWRWDGSETALRETTSTIHDAGPATGAILRSHTPGPDHPGTPRLDHRHRTRPRHHPRRHHHRRTLPERPPHRPGRRSPAPVVHHHPPHPDHHRPGRHRHHLTTPTHPGRRPPHGPGRDRHRACHHRPPPPPPTPDQNQAAVPPRPPRHHHPHRTRPRARLRHHRGLTPRTVRPPTRTSPPGRNPAYPARQPGHHHAPQPVSLSVHKSKITTKGPPPPRTTSSPWHWLSVTGLDAWRIASAAAAHCMPIQELTPRSASLEDAYLN
jgi:hypothetical protein